MMGRILRILPILLVLGVTACGGARHATLRVYFLRDGKVAPVARSISRSKLVEALWAGPTPEERQSGLTTALPKILKLKGLPAQGKPFTFIPAQQVDGRAAQAQIAFMQTQFAPNRPASEPPHLKRADFEDLTPAILVESPLPFETVRSPLRATGTANTFEATFQYELKDADGKVLAKRFVTATSGSGTRGTFDFTVPFAVDRAGPGTLTVYENSAENGSRIHIVDIPLQLEP